MVNVEKHRRKALENEFRTFIEANNGVTKQQMFKKTKELDSFIKPKLASGMNINHFRPQLKEEQELKKKIF